MFSKVSNKVWLTVCEDGSVSNAHCTCMAGQGSVCSHVGAILFYVHGVAEFKERQTPLCTSELCSWLPPSLKKVNFAAVKQIQFGAPARRFTSMISGNGSHTEESKAQLERQQSRDAVPVLSSDELQSFLADIKNTGIKSAVLQTHQAFCDDFIPFSARIKPPLTSLYDEKFAELPYHLLLAKCDEIFSNISITQDEVDIIEEKTRGQASSNLWFQQRSGIITASRFKAACRTDPAMPSQSLISGICYPFKSKFSTVATRYGCQHEKTAIEHLQQQLFPVHQGALLSVAGFYRSEKHPFIGASPDSIFTCKCHGKFVVEAKCPHMCKTMQKAPDEVATEERSFCLENVNGICSLRKDHSYYYQLQMQMEVCNVEASFFVVWSEKGSFIQMIPKDVPFIKKNLQKTCFDIAYSQN